MTQKLTLVVLNPGHFHAALMLRERHTLVNDDIHVFAEDGPDVDHFVHLVHAFNERPVNPTHWTLYVYRGADFLEKLLARRPGQVVIFAGRNSEKMLLIHLLHAQGFHVLGDKPWITDSTQLGLLREVIARSPLAMDIMTEREDIGNRVQRALARSPAVFGEFRASAGEPAIAMRSVHHLYKLVNKQPLQRPAWYFDPAEQGEGIMDVTTHLVDHVQWLTGDERAFEFSRDVEALTAHQWSSVIPRALFARITGLEDFPAFLRQRVVQDALHYPCNARLSYRLRGVPVEIESLWEAEEPPGGGDLQRVILRGSLCELRLERGPATGFRPALSLWPAHGSRAYARALDARIASLQREFPGVTIESAGAQFRVVIPPAQLNAHEQHFAAVLDTFLGCVDAGKWPARLAADLDMKYTLLARALELSRCAPGAQTDFPNQAMFDSKGTP